MDIRPDYANVKREDGIVEQVDPSEVQVGDVIVVYPGEKVPLDGIIVSGSTTLDTKALTGESLPRELVEGDDVISGCVNLTSQIDVQVTKVFYDSTVSKILDLVENASSKKSQAENFITKFAKYYTPTVVGVAVLLAIIGGAVSKDWYTWIYRGLSFLVVSCPCALVVSVPLSFFAGIGSASRQGILIKGSNYLEMLDRANVFVFDKTGTLTKGNFAVTAVEPESDKDEVLRLAAIAERDSNHPIARSIVGCYHGEIESGYTLTNVAGFGIIATKGDDVIYCGNEKLMKSYNIDFVKQNGVGTVVYVAKTAILSARCLSRTRSNPNPSKLYPNSTLWAQKPLCSPVITKSSPQTLLKKSDFPITKRLFFRKTRSNTLNNCFPKRRKATFFALWVTASTTRPCLCAPTSASQWAVWAVTRQSRQATLCLCRMI